MTQTLQEFGQRLRTAPAHLRKAEEQAVAASALAVKKSVVGQLQRAAPSGTVKGRRGRKVRLKVGYEVKHGGHPTALVRAIGPWQLIERDTRAHRIPAATSGRRKPLFLPGIGVRARVNHPGTRGKHPFEKGLEASRPDVRRVLGEEFHKALREMLR